MINTRSSTTHAELLARLGSHVQENVPMSSYTTARVGGKARYLLVIRTSEELAEAVTILWELETPFLVLGSGANVLFSDRGYNGVILLNRAHTIKVDAGGVPPTIWAESGANFGTVARRAAQRGLSGLEWAAGIPGTIGGAVYGNAGAHGSDMSKNLVVAEILHPNQGMVPLTSGQMEYDYRISKLKKESNKAIILAARLKLEKSTPESVKVLMEKYSAQRKRTQPPGASMGSIFKNPPGDYAGRLIESAGLKGTRSGGVVVSQVHANFFINDAGATAMDYWKLIQQVRQKVMDQFGVRLDLEVELLGNWTEKLEDRQRNLNDD